MKSVYFLCVAVWLLASSAFADEAAAPEAVAAPVVDAAPAAAPAAPASFVAADTEEIGKPSPGMGQIVFFRPRKLVGAVIGYKVREAGKELGRLENGNYFVLSVEPGKHQYVVHSEAKDVLTMEVEAGEVYYVIGSLSMGVLTARPNLSPSNAAAFEEARRKRLEKSSI